MNESKSVIGIIVTHGDLGRELLATAGLIVGNISDCYYISGSNLTNEKVIEEIIKLAGREGEGGVVMFVDHFGGSCCTVCISAMRGRDKATIISGANLPLILDFINKRESMEYHEMIEHLIQRGRESVRVIEC